jgi:hypothetical protein
MSHPSVQLTRFVAECPLCGKRQELVIDANAYIRWRDGRVLIQQAFPGLTAGERELIQTGTCQPCWDLMWAYLEQEQEC